MLAALSLSACLGGGGDSDGAAPSPAPAPTPTPAPEPPPPAPASLVISGTAATGAAVAGGTVEARCASGTGQATSAANGQFSISVTGGSLPCVLRVSLPSGEVLHSVASGSGTTATANVSPLTQLVLAQALGAAPSGLWDNFQPARVSTDLLTTAASAVAAVLRSAGVDASAITNPFTDALVAAAGNSAGNGHDQVLDALKAKLTTSGTTLAGLTEVVASSAPAAAAAPSGVPSLPPELLLQPAAANCSAMRSGRYRMVIAAPSGAVSEHPVVAGRFDATTLTWTDDNGNPNDGGTFVANGPCRYTTPSGELVVSQAGVWVFRSVEEGVVRLGIAVPEQRHTLASLQGNWRAIEASHDSLLPSSRAALELLYAGVTLDGAGRASAVRVCEVAGTCLDVGATDLAGISASLAADGVGFVYQIAGDPETSRVFVYRAGGGEAMALFVTPTGTLSFWTRARTLATPVAGTTSSSWNHAVAGGMVAGAGFTDAASTIRSVDAAAGSYLRDSVINATTGATRPETLQVNQPTSGYQRRVPEVVSGSDGSSQTVGEFVLLPLRGMGMSVLAIPANRSLVVAVNKP